MRLQWLSLLGIIILSYPTAGMAEEQAQDSIPPEKVNLIYETLLPPEGNLAVESKGPTAVDEKQDRAASERIARMLERQGIELNGWPGLWEFQYGGRKIFLLTTLAHNRVRFVTPIVEMRRLRDEKDFDEAKLYEKLLKANYLMTEETHFALNREVVWLCYSHPLDSASEQDVISALKRLSVVAAETSGGRDLLKKEAAEFKELLPCAR